MGGEIEGFRVNDDPKRVPIVVAETEPFLREARKLFDEAELEKLRDHAALFRELGQLIKETGGLRKTRWATNNNKGKSHGARIIYYYGGDHMPLYLIAVYPKSKRATLSNAAKKAARKLVATLKKEFEPKSRKGHLRLVTGSQKRGR